MADGERDELDAEPATNHVRAAQGLGSGHNATDTQGAEADPTSLELPSEQTVPGTSDREKQELFIGLVGAMGTNLEETSDVLYEILQSYGYECDVVQISELIKRVPEYASFEKRHAYEYYDRMIEGGNKICEVLNDKGALAEMAVWRVHEIRNERPVTSRRAFIFRSLKRPEEARRLREMYGGLFYTVAVFADEDTREDRMTRRINMDVGRPDDPNGRPQAQRLIRRDEREDMEWGQKVSDTFAEADYFVRSDDATELRTALTRFVTLVFKKPYVSPTRSEVAMMHAYAAGLRSADLSRQIGAVIVARDGRVLTTGCNEVPRPGGGQYWAGDKDDARDWRLGRDMNDLKKRDTIVELISKLDGVILPEHLLDGVDPLYEDLAKRKTFQGTRADALIEFGRVAHAEMAALNGALLETIRIRDADLYCTTFPCHMCTRLIIGAGIRNVFYIEPYPKSVALELYGKNEIKVNPTLTPPEVEERQRSEKPCDLRTYYIPFEGVAPRRYPELFSNGKQKNNDGTVKGFKPLDEKPRRTPTFIAVHMMAEPIVAENIKKRTAKLRRPKENV
jgi:deoxycytidylate deaminase